MPQSAEGPFQVPMTTSIRLQTNPIPPAIKQDSSPSSGILIPRTFPHRNTPTALQLRSPNALMRSLSVRYLMQPTMLTEGCTSGGFANSSHRAPGSWQNLLLRLALVKGRLCQLNTPCAGEFAKPTFAVGIGQWRLCQHITPRAGELAKPTFAGGFDLGGFANSTHRALGSWQNLLLRLALVNGSFANSTHRMMGSWQNLFPNCTLTPGTSASCDSNSCACRVGSPFPCGDSGKRGWIWPFGNDIR